MDITTNDSFIKAFNAIAQATAAINLVDESVKSGKASKDAPSTAEIKDIKDELAVLMNLLMSLKQDTPNSPPVDDATKVQQAEQIEQKSISILSSATAFFKLIDALLETEEKLRQMEKEFRARLKANKELEMLKEKAFEISKNMRILMDIISENKNIDSSQIKNGFAQSETFNKFMLTNFGVEVNLNPSINIVI